MSANCFIVGKAENNSRKSVYDADILGAFTMPTTTP